MELFGFKLLYTLTKIIFVIKAIDTNFVAILRKAVDSNDGASRVVE